MRTRLFLPLLLLSVFLPLTARAAWDVYGNAVVASPYGQSSAVTVADGFGGALVAWQDQRNGGEDIYVQRVNGSGAVQWTANGVAVCNASGLQWGPQIASDGAGGVFVVWVDQRTSAATGNDLYVQRVNSSGVVQWTTDGLPVCTATGNQEAHRVLPDGVGGALMIWADGRNPYGRDIYIQRVSSSGVMQWLANGDTLCTASQDQYEPLLVPDTAGGAIGIWRDWRNGQHGDIYAQRFNASGEPLWAPNGISVRGTIEEDVVRAAVSDNAGGAIVISIELNDIHAQRVSSNGVPQWGATGVALCTHWSGEVDPTCVTDGAGGAIVAWKDLRDPNGDIYAQRIDFEGNRLWWPTGEWVGALAYAQLRPQAISDGTGGAIVTWYDLRTNVSYDIYAQRLDSSGAAQWPQNGVALTTRGADQKFPVIAPDGSGGGIVAWEDIRELTGGVYYTDIYARRVTHGGSVITGVGSSTPSLRVGLGEAHPNPFSDATALELRLPREVDVGVEVFDVAGRRMRSDNLGRRKAGSWSIRFDGRDDGGRSLPSGVYFFRLHAGDETVTRKIVIAR